jgi:hypothetical protein
MHWWKRKFSLYIYKEIQNGAVAKSYMSKGFLIYEEMRKYLAIYEEAVSRILLCTCSIMNFLIYEENFIFFRISVCNDEYTESTDLIIKDLRKNYSSRDTIPLINCSLFRQDKSTVLYIIHAEYCHGVFLPSQILQVISERGFIHIGLPFT